MTTTNTSASAEAAQGRINPLYFALWRWHFYAGLYVIPFLITLACSGLIIVWVTAIAPEYGDRLPVQPEGTALSLTEQEAAVAALYPGAPITKYIAPYDAATPALFRVAPEAGSRILALDPYRGTVLQDRIEGDTWNEWATALHGELLLGANGGWGDLLIEIAASLGLMLVATGLYLAWPRKGGGFSAMFLPQLSARGRALWKSLHTVTGTWLSLVLTFFFISGLAWAGIWGDRFVQAWSTFPAEKWDNVPLSDATHASLNHGAEEQVPWALVQTPMPASGSEAGVAGVPEGTPVTLESLAALARSLGIEGRFQLAAPDGETGVWTLSQDSMSYDSSDPTIDRTVHIDQYTGKVLADVRFADYSVPGKAMAVGIALHEGMMGLWNVVLNIAFCLLVIATCLFSVVMWWKRRPARALRLAAPPRPDLVPLAQGMALIGLFLSMAFPVLGLTLLAVLALDLLVIRHLPPLRRFLS
jgi:uncharacterized iron-regulated membrane protein